MTDVWVSSVRLLDEQDNVVKTEKIYHIDAKDLREKARIWATVNKLKGSKFVWNRLESKNGTLSPIEGKSGSFKCF